MIPTWMRLMCEGWVTFDHYSIPNEGYNDTLTGEIKNVIVDAYQNALMDPTLEPINSLEDNYPEVHRLNGYVRDGTQVYDFTQQITLSISYNDGFSKDVPENAFVICELDSAKKKWTPLDSTWVDTDHDLVNGMIGDFQHVYSILAYFKPKSVCTNFGNFPNPFQAGRENTTLSYVLSNYAAIKIRVFTIMGAPVRSWEYEYNDPMGRGNSTGSWHTVQWDGRNDEGRAVSNGTYVGVLTATDIDGGILCEVKTVIAVAR
jgi:hypothetical protein